MLFNSVQNPRSTEYCISRSWFLEGYLDIAALQKAWQTVCKTHPMLRTKISTEGGKVSQAQVNTEPDQLIVSRAHIELEMSEIQKEAIRHSTKPMPVDHGEPLARCEVTSIDESRHILSIVTHHIISDGLSLSIITEDLSSCYNMISAGRTVHLPAERKSYYEYLEDQQRKLQDVGAKEKLDALVENVRGVGRFVIPFDRAGRREYSDNAQTVTTVADESVNRALRAVAADTRVTPYMAILAAFGLVLSRYAGQDDVVIGTSFAARQDGRLQRTVGLFANAIPTVLRQVNSGTYRSLLEKSREACMTAFECADIPYESIVSALEGSGMQRDEPTIQALAQIHEASQLADQLLRLNGMSARTISKPAHAVHFGLELDVVIGEDGLVISLTYNPAKYGHHAAYCLAHCTSKALSEIALSPDAPTRAFSMSDNENRRLSSSHLASKLRPGQGGSKAVHQRFIETAAKYPDRIALASPDSGLSFRSADRLSQRVAQTLNEDEVSGSVALIGHPTPLLVAALFGIWRSGRVVVPLGTQWPETIASQACSTTGTALVLTDGTADDRRTALPRSLSILSVAHLIERTHGSESPVQHPVTTHAVYRASIDSNDPPAMIAMTHENLDSLHSGMINIIERCAPELRGQIAVGIGEEVYDLGFWQKVGLVTSGHTLHLSGGKMLGSAALPSQYIVEHDLQLASVTPDELPRLAELHQAASSPIRLVMNDGEDLLDGIVPKLASSSVGVVDVRGPAECSGAAAWALVRDGEIVAHTPWSGATLWATDHTDCVLPRGIAGSLAVTGPAVTSGYVSSARLTASRFRPLVKDRAASRAFYSHDSIVIAAEGGLIWDSEKPRTTRAGRQASALRPRPAAKPAGRSAARVSAMDLADLRTFLLRTWEQELNVTELTDTDDFFEVGGDSLHALQVIASIREYLGLPIPLWQLTKSRTVDELARALAELPNTNDPTLGQTEWARLSQPTVNRNTGNRLLITGGSGRIGRYVVKALLGQGYLVTALARPESVADMSLLGSEPHLSVVPGDARDSALLGRLAREAEGIVHMACTFGLDDVDIAAMEALVSNWKSGPFIFLSSASVYDSQADIPAAGLAEDVVLQPRTSYGLMKYRSEQILIRAAALGDRHHAILRAPHVWAPDFRFAQQLRWIDCRDTLDALTKGIRIEVPSSARDDVRISGTYWIDARDLAQIIGDALRTPGFGVMNVASGRIVTHEMLDKLGEHFPRPEAADQATAKVETGPAQASMSLMHYAEKCGRPLSSDWRAVVTGMLRLLYPSAPPT